jgi:hypothetical protein
VARGNDVFATLARVDRHRDRPRAIACGNASGHALAGLDRDREGGLHRLGMVAAHRLEPQVEHALAGQRQANEATAVRGHEIDRRRGRHLRGNDQIAFVLAVLVIDQHEHSAVARFVDDVLDRRQHGICVVPVEKAGKLAERLGGGVPTVLIAIAQRVGMEAGSAGEAAARHRARCDESTGAGDRLVHERQLAHWNVTAKIIHI